MTVRMPTEADKRRAELIAQGILPDLAPERPRVGAKGRAEADKRFKKTGA